MKRRLHLAVECPMAAKERPVEPAGLGGRSSARAAGSLREALIYSVRGEPFDYAQESLVEP
jgi:hypothetical protein